ncbi:type VI secretion system Vgr family protein [Dechloromonas agitata]|uniref:type VI secretion system Vgr family protein n=1 Tax=Dechloromonas agitata TaxID=73030 RepID=UPI0004B0BECE|nr:type VI secretion system Vgr family protein [Dechloromonas agitata]
MNTLLDMIAGGAGWSQNDRLLKLTTPAGPEALLAERVTIDEALGPVVEHAGFRIELSALSLNADQSLTALLGQPVRLDLQTSASRDVRRPFHGHITQITRQGADGGFGRYRLIIEPWLAFLGHNRDNYLFQDKSVIDIVDELLGDWKGQGKLVPDWEWRLADPAAYPKRGMTVQYRESDLAFLKRLLAEEGLFCWFEHRAEAGEALGRHSLIIADRNGAFAPNPQPRIRYTQAGATLGEDSLDQWHGLRQIDTTDSHASSWDYRSLSSRPQSAASAIANGQLPRTAAWHDPGQYAWPNSAHGERMLGNQRQAIDARLKQYHGQGTVRSAAPGTTFTLADHPEHDRDTEEHRQFLITAVTHEARNALNMLSSANANGNADQESTEEHGIDFYRNRISALRADIPWKPLSTDAHGRCIHPRPTARGTLTAIVVGDGSPTHTDRDHRVRVQFPWQRGSQAASRSPHPSGSDNAPAGHALGVWLRVMSPVAGGNWGGHLVPRPGQEVLVAFQDGNIDRPLIIGAAYNGSGQTDVAGNCLGSGTQQASPNAPAFFAGQSDRQHTHQASLSGLKTQQLATSRNGQGGHNHLVFDDTPGESRIELGTTQYQSHLQLGHLKQQTGNARQADRGHGAELKTQASLALRAGNGLYLSTDARPHASGAHLDSGEAIAQTEDAQRLSQSLAAVAAQQNAALQGDPAADQLPAIDSLQHAASVLKATASQNVGQGSHGTIKTTQGGTGSIPAWSEPRLQLNAPAGIAQLTPQDQILAAGKHLTIATGQDTNLIAQGNHSLAVKNGLALYTVGKAGDKQKPNQETGIHLHAASGSVSLQSQSGKTTAAADKKVTLASTTGNLNASAKQKILATAQGAYLKIEGGSIELHAPGKVEFKASQKSWTGPASASPDGLSFPKSKDLYDEQFVIRDEKTQAPIAGAPYRIVNGKGLVVFSGIADEKGQTARLTFAKAEQLKLQWGK